MVLSISLRSLLLDVIRDFQRIRPDLDSQRCLFRRGGIKIGFTGKIPDRDGRIVPHRREHSAGKRANGKPARALIKNIARHFSSELSGSHIDLNLMYRSKSGIAA